MAATTSFFPSFFLLLPRRTLFVRFGLHENARVIGNLGPSIYFCQCTGTLYTGILIYRKNKYSVIFGFDMCGCFAIAE